MSGRKHGYGAYTKGCRCEVCRAAKADYMRAKRARARKYAATGSDRGPNFIPEITHGISGYQNHRCRCDVCVTANRTNNNRQWRAARGREGRCRMTAPEILAALALPALLIGGIAAARGERRANRRATRRRPFVVRVVPDERVVFDDLADPPVDLGVDEYEDAHDRRRR